MEDQEKYEGCEPVPLYRAVMYAMSKYFAIVYGVYSAMHGNLEEIIGCGVIYTLASLDEPCVKSVEEDEPEDDERDPYFLPPGVHPDFPFCS